MEARIQSSHIGHQRPATSIGTKVRDYTTSHRKTVAIATILIVAGAFAVPFVIQAASNEEGKAMQQNNQTSPQAESNVESVQQTERQTEQTTTVQSEEKSNSKSETNVTVNGERVEVPENGSYSKTIEDGDSRTDIKVQSNHSSTSSGNSASNNSSVNVNIKSESHSSSSD